MVAEPEKVQHIDLVAAIKQLWAPALIQRSPRRPQLVSSCVISPTMVCAQFPNT